MLCAEPRAQPPHTQSPAVTLLLCCVQGWCYDDMSTDSPVSSHLYLTTLPPNLAGCVGQDNTTGGRGFCTSWVQTSTAFV
jgi:hypothetical protein